MYNVTPLLVLLTPSRISEERKRLCETIESMQRILLQWLVLIQNLLLIVWYQAVTGSDIIGTLGNSVSIDCKVPISDTLIWESRDGNVIAVRGQPVVRDSTKYLIEKQHGVREFLVIHNLTLADETEYCCYDLRHTDVKDRTTLTILGK